MSNSYAHNLKGKSLLCLTQVLLVHDVELEACIACCTCMWVVNAICADSDRNKYHYFISDCNYSHYNFTIVRSGSIKWVELAVSVYEYWLIMLLLLAEWTVFVVTRYYYFILVTYLCWVQNRSCRAGDNTRSLNAWAIAWSQHPRPCQQWWVRSIFEVKSLRQKTVNKVCVFSQK